MLNHSQTSPPTVNNSVQTGKLPNIEIIFDEKILVDDFNKRSFKEKTMVQVYNFFLHSHFSLNYYGLSRIFELPSQFFSKQPEVKILSKN